MSDAYPPLLTIICPVRNMAGKLQNLDSWLARIPNHTQVVLIYDESSDNTLLELNQLVSKNPRKAQIKILMGSFQAPGLARNAGIQVAEGKWISFWDSDDIGFPTRLMEFLVSRKANNNSLGVYCFGYEVVSTAGALCSWKGWRNSKKSNLELVSLNPGLWRFCFSREIVLSREFSSLLMGEDQLYLAQIGLENLPINFEEMVIYKYFKNIEGQLTKSADALVNLGSSIRLLREERILTSGQSPLIDRLLVRQSMTAIRIPDRDLKSTAVATLFLVFKDNPILCIKQLFGIVWGWISG